MIFAPLYKYFPEVAQEETRCLTIMNNPGLPDGRYHLTELFCNKPNCDCRRVFFHIEASVMNQPLAVIAYGWENKEFYANWMGDSNPSLLKELQGPSLNSASPQSRYAPALLKLVEFVLGDETYVERLKRHYKMFKAYIKDNIGKEEVSMKACFRRSHKKTGRNAPCPCGSGSKYKKCCLEPA